MLWLRRCAKASVWKRGSNKLASACAADGSTKWEYAYESTPSESQSLDFGSGPNTTPLIIGDRVFTVGFMHQMHALDRKTGKLLWKRNLAADFGAPEVYFGYASSPIDLDGDVLVLTGGEQAAVVLSASDGTVKWEGPKVPISASFWPSRQEKTVTASATSDFWAA